MPRFQVEVWDRRGFIQDKILDSATNLRVVQELNADYTFEFLFPINDPKYKFIKAQKIIRLVDNDINTYPTSLLYAPPILKEISVYDGSNYNIGDFLIIYEKPPMAVSKRVTTAIAGNRNSSQSINLNNVTGITANDYLRIEDKDSSEIIRVISTSPGIIVAYVINNYDVNASVTAPGRSLIAKITTARKGAGKLTQNLELAGSNVVIELSSTNGIRPGDYVRIYGAINSEYCYVTAVNPTVSITVQTLAQSYPAGSTVDNYSFGLSRRDFQSDPDALVEKVNFTTFRVSGIEEVRSQGIPMAKITCNHIGYDLNNQCYLENGRGDISYKEQGSGQILSDAVDLDSLVDAMLNRQADSLGTPFNEDYFFKGDLYSFRYNAGTISVTSGSATITGSGTDWSNISSGSLISIEGDESLYTIKQVVATSIVLTANVSRETGSGIKYLIIQSGIQTNQSDIICEGDVRQIADNQIDNIQDADMLSGDVRAGAILRIEGDLGWYYIKEIADANTVILTTDVTRVADTGLAMLITRDEREIEFSEATPLRGVLNKAGEIWSDFEQVVWYEIGEDKSINIVRKTIPDDRDPTSDLIVRYSYNWVTNLEAVRRIYDQREFGNRVLAVGAKTGWINASTKVSEEVISEADNRTSSFLITSGSNYKFRPADPVQLLREYFEVVVIDATPDSITITGYTPYDYYDDGGVYYDDTTEAGDATPDDVYLLPAPPAANDARYFGSSGKFNTITANISTIGQAPTSSTINWSVVWEYWNGVAWTTLSFTTQQMDNFYNSMFDVGIYQNQFLVPGDWATTTVNGQSAYWVRARVSSITTGIDDSGVDNKAYLMTDTTQNFNGATGMIIYNLSDPGSSGTVTSVSTTTNPNDTLNFSAGLSGGVKNEFDNGDTYFVWIQPLAAQLWHNNLLADDYAGGMVTVYSGEGEGQFRRIVDNTATQINVARDWDKLPITSTVLISKDIGNAVVRGCGYEKWSPEVTTTAAYVDVYDVDSVVQIDYAYRGGILNVVSGPGAGQAVEISYNTIGDYDADSNSDDIRFYINGTFLVPPTTDSIIDVIAPTQMAEEYRSGTTFTASTAVFTPTAHSMPPMVNDMWNGGTLYVTSGDDEGNSYAITDTAVVGGVVTITITGTFGTTPTAEDGILLIKSHDLPISVAPGLRWNPEVGTKICLLLKETGGGLTVGKHYEHRSTVTEASQTTITLEDATNFEANQTLMVGAKTITSSLTFGMRKGDQAMGEVVTISGKSGNIITTVETLNPTPKPGDQVEILTLVNTGSINEYGIVENSMTANDITNPRELYHDASKFLAEISDLIPRYEVDFTHLYELDPSRWKFDNFYLGDTIRVIDDDINIDEDNLRIIREEYNPNFPADVKIQIAKKLPTETVGRAGSLDVRVAHIEEKQLEQERVMASPTCVYWDNKHKSCGRHDPPNTFCNSHESNKDGTLAAPKMPLSKEMCEAFTPITDDLTLGTDEGAIVTARDFVIECVDNDEWDWTHIAAISIDHEVMPNSWAFITELCDCETNSRYTGLCDLVEVRVAINDLTGNVIPQDEGSWYGCYVQGRRKSGTASITIYGTVLLVRRRW